MAWDQMKYEKASSSAFVPWWRHFQSAETSTFIYLLGSYSKRELHCELSIE